MRAMKRDSLGRRVLSVLLAAVMMAGMANFALPAAKAAGGTASAAGATDLLGGKRQADPSTMDTYKEMLNFDTNTRYAGRLWSDKTVFALGDKGSDTDWDGSVLTLDREDDGVDETTVTLDEDFLHIYSVLGSSQQIIESSPLDVMFVVDVSGSMGKSSDGKVVDSNSFEGSAIRTTVDAINAAIVKLLDENPESRFGIAIYGATAAVLVPLGHYTKDSTTPFLKAEIDAPYGDQPNYQGLHYKLTATVVEIDDATEQKKEFYADNAGQTSNKAHDANGDGNREIKGTGGATEGDGTSGNPYHVGHITNPQAGLAAAMEQFIEHEERTWETNNGRTCLRIPALIHLTDGQASDIAWIQPTAGESGTEGIQEWEKTVSNWNDVNWKYDLAYNSKNKNTDGKNQWNASQLTGPGDAQPVIFQTLMTAAYYKSAVEAFYNRDGAIKDLEGDPVSLTCYSVYASDEMEYGELEDNQVKATIDSILGPTKYFREYTEPNEAQKIINGVYELFDTWKSENPVKNEYKEHTTSSKDEKNDITITLNASKDQTGSGKYGTGYEKWNSGITAEAVEKNINYVPEGNFFYTGFDKLNEVFSNIIQRLTSSVFAPVGGMNDLGVKDSITYMDPVGKYMEVKDVKGLTLFGQYYDITKTAVYDYKWNHQYMVNLENENTQPLTAGWYLGDPVEGSNEAVKYGGAEEKPKDYEETDPWADGWVYRVGFNIASQFVPTLETINVGDGADKTVAKQRNTEYTFYRIVNDEEARKELHMNPAYLGKNQTEESALMGKTYKDDGSHEKDPGVYALADLRIWVEDSGDYNDSLPGTEIDTNYDEALWINVPVNMLPLRKVTIDASKGNEITYTTNIPKSETVKAGSVESASFPLRVIYTVGVSDDVLDGNRVDVARAISPEYIQQNKITSENAALFRRIDQGQLEFFSNWYNPLGRYTDYKVDKNNDYTFGDPVVSFSPSKDNRYYIFEKALPLYKNAYQFDGTEWKSVADNASAFVGGKLIADDLESEDDISEKLKEKGIYPQNGDVVLLQGDRFNNESEINKDGYYFLAIEYYNLLKDSNKAELERFVVARKGNNLEVFTDSEHDGFVSTNPGGLRVGNLAQNVKSKGNYDEKFIAPGSEYLTDRFGAESNAGELAWFNYTENTTRTANNYYFPTISKHSDPAESGSLAIVNVYLGNNGRLWVPDATLRVTKTVKPGSTGSLEGKPTDKFSFTIQINGLNGTYPAIMLRSDGENWGRQIHYIDLMLSGNHYLMTADGSEATFNEKGELQPDGTGQYYAKMEPGGIGADGALENSVRVYHNSALKAEGDEGEAIKGVEAKEGSLTVEVTLVDKDGKTEKGKVRIPVLSADDSETSFTTDYLTSSAYRTRNVTFAYGTASVTLLDKEGLLFNGLPGGRAYSVTETLTEDQILEGFSFHHVDHNGDSVEETTVTGQTDLTVEKYADYVNIWNTDKRETDITRHDGSTEHVDPGTGFLPGVQVGDTISYEIKWNNTTGENAEVTITDKLDPGVDFVEASDPGVYDKTTHTITWELGEQVPGAKGEVTFKVKVNENAKVYWDYDHDGLPDEEVTGNDYLVRNRGTVYVGENKFNTNTVVNPVGEPDKNETKVDGNRDVEPGDDGNVTKQRLDADGNPVPNLEDGPLVYVGDKITYEIEWRNYQNKDAAITITDPLDANVKFVSAHFDDGTVKADLADPDRKTDATVKVDTEDLPVIAYSEDGPTVTWNLGVQHAGASGKVTLVVEVLGTAAPAGKVGNTAYVQVNGDPKMSTKTVENPTPEVHKKENTPGDGERVEVGSRIDYQIAWDTNQGELNDDERVKQVVVTDPLDPGVDFVQASYDGVVLTTPENWTGGDLLVTGDSETGKCSVSIEYKQSTHTVIWTVTEKDGSLVPVEDHVNLTVEVTDRAVVKEANFIKDNDELPTNGADDWTYRVNDGIEAEDGQLVQNRGAVKFDNDADIATELVKNPLTPDKEETDPGDGDQVDVGREITYKIHWQNYRDADAFVTVTDPLDKGVDFVSAAFESEVLKADADGGDCRTPAEKEGADGDSVPVIAYDAENHCVTWNLGKRSALESGTVTLVVKVNENAVKTWQYGTGDEPAVNDETKDHEVVDRAGVQVNHEPKIYTKVVENPVPEKTETAAGDDMNPKLEPKEGADNTVAGPLVMVGDEIVYLIDWKNGYDKTATVIVTDQLDRGVDFVSAAFGGVTLDAGNTSGTATGDDDNIVITYDKARHTVTWTLKDRAAGDEGNVALTVKVNAKATPVGSVKNQAMVTVGNKSGYTGIVENPTPELEKTEITPGENMPVKPGDPVDYAINWNNYTEDDAVVVVRDALDPGVNFRSAEFTGDGDVENNTVSITWNDADPTPDDDTTCEAAKPSGVISATSEITVKGEKISVEIKYVPKTHQITWTFGTETNGVPAGFASAVNFSVVVNDDADRLYTYNDEAEITGDGTEEDKQILNQGGVKVGNNDEQYTKVIPNPLEPGKDETDINGNQVATTVKTSGNVSGSPDVLEGPEVSVDDVIRYTITWLNDATDENGVGATADVTIVDTLGTGLKFVAAGFVTRGADGEMEYSDKVPAGWSVSAEGQTVTWRMPRQDFNAKGMVWVQARVTEDAVEFVRNSAVLHLDDDSRQLNDIDNPVRKESGLIVSKTVTGSGDKTKEWHFTVTLSDTTVNGFYGAAEDGMAFENGVAEFTLKHGQSRKATGLPADITYTVAEEEADQDGYTTEASGETGTLKADKLARAEFTNDKPGTPPPPGDDTVSLTVRKTVTGAGDKTKEWHFRVELEDKTISGTYGEMTFELGVAEFTLRDGQSLTARRLPVGTRYTVTEAEADKDGYTTTAENKKGTINSGKATVEFTNDLSEDQPHKKENTPGNGVVVGIGEEIEYEISWKNGEAAAAKVIITDPLDPGVDFVNASFGDLTLTGEGSVESEEKAESGDPLVRIEYQDHTVVWTLADRAVDETGSVKLTVKVNENARVEHSVENQAKVQVGNKPVQDTEIVDNPLEEFGSLEVHKTVTSKNPDTDKEWSFTVTLSDNTINGVYGDMEFTNGVATFTLKHNESKTAKGLPAGTGYTVVENNANEGDYTTTSEGETGTVPGNGTAHAGFQNWRPDGDQHKAELVPGDGKYVFVGDRITYQIDWENYTGKEAEISITDTLDPGVDFVSAGVDGVELTADDPDRTVTKDGITISYSEDENGKTVTWNLGKKGADEKGVVTLIVEVNENARQAGIVKNKATVEVDHDPHVTEEPENPTGEPHKTETKPGDKVTVGVGQEITYDITWQNYKDGKATVTITDPLDEGVDFVSASVDGVTLTAADEDGTVTENGITIKYDKRTVTWELGEKDQGAKGDVRLVVRVNSKALLDDHKVVNQATVTVDNEPQQTEIPENPVGGPHKTEVTPGDGLHVDIGEDITYNITWENYKDEAATVTVRDPLDKNVEFVSATVGNTTLTADDDGTITENGVTITYAGHQVTWELGEQGAGTSGCVVLVVRVLESALQAPDKTVYNQAFVKINGDPEQETEIPKNPTDETPEEGTGNLTVTKRVTGSAGDTDKVFRFTVTLSDSTINKQYGDMTFVNGVAGFTLKHNESKTATGLPAGITYTVTEAEANTEGYTTSSTGDEGTIPNGGTAYAIFVNGKDNPPDEPDKGNLTVTKTVSGNAVSTQTEFHFTVTLSDTAVNGWFGDMNFVNGVATFTLKHNESKTATGLPAGVTYTVTEEEYNHNGYTSTSTGSTGVIPGSGTASAAFRNSRSVTTQGTPGRLVVRKLVTGEGDKDKEFTFRVTLSYTGANGTYGDMVFVNGVAEFTAKSGENVIGRYIPAGVTYKVEELEADQDGYETIASGEIGTIDTDVISEVRFENHMGPWEPDEPWEEFWDPDIPLVDFPPDTPPTNTPIIPETDYPPYIPPVNIPEYTPPTEIPTVPGNPTPNTPTVPVDDVPDTGDNSNIGLWIVLAALAVLGVAVLVPKKKRDGRD